MFENLNHEQKQSTVREDIVLKDLPFKKLRDFVGKEVAVDGFFFTTKGRFGKQVVVVGNGCAINMPVRATEEFEAIANDPVKVEAVLNGHLKLVDIKPIVTKKGNLTIAYTYADR